LLLASCGADSSSRAVGAVTDHGGSPGARLLQPSVLQSTNGLLEVSLLVKAGLHPWGSGNRYALSYNGSTPGPTLRVRPGDTMRITLRNELDQETNLHTHGLHVSPSGISDNIYRMATPGQSLACEYTIPIDHRSGTFWYHPHLHGLTASQVAGGLAGAIVVDDSIDDALSETTDRLLILSDPKIDPNSKALDASLSERQAGREGDVLLVNGQLRPSIHAQVGDIERWRLVNASPSRYYRLRLSGLAMSLIGTDQGRLSAPMEISEVFLTPGQRAEVLVPIVASGKASLTATPVTRSLMSHGGASASSSMGGMSGMSDAGARSVSGVTLITVDATARSSRGSPRAPSAINPAIVILPTAVDRRRTISLGAMAMGNAEFVINGRTFDKGRIDINTTGGDTEEWVLVNDSMMDHPFHLHVWPFKVVARSDGAPDPGWRDTVNVPSGGTVTIRVPFTDFTGTSVFHCHILDHEDLGMMGQICVV
jgi:FtsP/CotA-like multicopper oxidase with cupredoxin domain